MTLCIYEQPHKLINEEFEYLENVCKLILVNEFRSKGQSDCSPNLGVSTSSVSNESKILVGFREDSNAKFSRWSNISILALIPLKYLISLLYTIFNYLYIFICCWLSWFHFPLVPFLLRHLDFSVLTFRFNLPPGLSLLPLSPILFFGTTNPKMKV